STNEQIIDAMETLGRFSNDVSRSGDAVSFSADGRLLISRHMLFKKLFTETWDTVAGTLVRVPEDSLQDRGKPYFSPDGRYRALSVSPVEDLYKITASDYMPAKGFLLGAAKSDVSKVLDQEVTLYDGKTNKKLREFSGGKAPVSGIAPVTGFSVDGKLIAITGFEKKDTTRSVLIFDTATGHKLNSFPINDEQGGGVATLAISADARLLAAGLATKIELIELATGRVIRSLPHLAGSTSLTFSSDGRFL